MSVDIVITDSYGTLKFFDSETKQEIYDVHDAEVSINANDPVYVVLKIPVNSGAQFVLNAKREREYDEGLPIVERK